MITYIFIFFKFIFQGVLVINPDMAVFSDMLARKEHLSSYDGGDTGFLNSYFPDWYRMQPTCRLSFGYNAQRTMYWFTRSCPGYWNSIKPLKVR
jgi:hypothetical protein